MTTHLKWWQHGVIYQIYPRSFQDTDDSGVGDLQGIIDHLDYLTWLGVDAIWISPFYPSPMADFGYDIADYCDVDPIFGDLATFDRLIEAAHQRDIRVLVDYVPNHTSNQHPWFVESRSSRHNPKRDWYIWRDAGPDGERPNNWGSMFGGPAWTWDETTQQYYFHQFAPEQPDLNWRNPAVREAMKNVLRFWFERGVDGFRMDVVYFIWKHPDMPDQPPATGVPMFKNQSLYSTQQHIYDQNQEGIQGIIREFRQLGDSYGETVLIGEIWLDLPQLVPYYGVQGEGMQMPFNFRLISLPWQADTFRASIDEYDAALPDFAWPNYVLGNHDMKRLASRFGAAQARTAAMLLLTLRGTPTLYYGDELGMVSGDVPPEKTQDPQGKILGPDWNRDNWRTPMQWSTARHAGFSKGNPWLPVNSDYTARNVAVLREEKGSILHLYRRLLAYRRESPALLAGRYESLDAPDGVFMYQRLADDTRCLIALNFTGDEKAIEAAGQIVLSTHMDRQESVHESCTLRPYEGVIIELA